VWISPHASREAEAKQVIESLGLQAASFSFNGPYAGIGSERTMVEQAWHLGDLAAGYEAFIQEFAGLRPDPGEPVLLAQIRLVHRWRRFPLLDPRLPLDLLPPDWIGIRAANVFNDLHQQWHRPAQRHWAALQAAGE
jgi:phenylacetic acid degradation operon negative regulatory protein